MVKVILFDCFGVLVEDSMITFCKTYLRDKPKLVEATRMLDRQSNEGKISFDDFVSSVAELTGIELKEVDTFLNRNPPNEELLNYIDETLKPKYKIGLLSNAADDWLDELFTNQQQGLFDDFVLSYQHGISKPDARIYELAARRLDVKPEECIFIDDVAAYVVGAEAIGMPAVQYQSVDQIKLDLSKLLGH